MRLTKDGRWDRRFKRPETGDASDMASGIYLVIALLACWGIASKVKSCGESNDAAKKLAVAPTAQPVTTPTAGANEVRLASAPAASDCPPFNVQVAIPSDFNPGPGGPTTDTYNGRDGATLVVERGCLSGKTKNVADMWNAALRQHEQDRVTLKRKGGTWYALSGFSGTNIFYTKAIASGPHWASFTLTYGEGHRETYDSLVARMEKSLAIVE
jgi:hypothetical protein